jgi:hypothetical protein
MVEVRLTSPSHIHLDGWVASIVPDPINKCGFGDDYFAHPGMIKLVLRPTRFSSQLDLDGVSQLRIFQRNLNFPVWNASSIVKVDLKTFHNIVSSSFAFDARPFKPIRLSNGLKTNANKRSHTFDAAWDGPPWRTMSTADHQSFADNR